MILDLSAKRAYKRMPKFIKEIRYLHILINTTHKFIFIQFPINNWINNFFLITNYVKFTPRSF